MYLLISKTQRWKDTHNYTHIHRERERNLPYAVYSPHADNRQGSAEPKPTFGNSVWSSRLEDRFLTQWSFQVLPLGLPLGRKLRLGAELGLELRHSRTATGVSTATPKTSHLCAFVDTVDD